MSCRTHGRTAVVVLAGGGAVALTLTLALAWACRTAHAQPQPQPQPQSQSTWPPGGDASSGGGAAAASETPAPAGPLAAGSELESYFQALTARRLISPETGSDVRLRDVVRRAEDFYLDERYDDAALLLFEVAESPRFADFVDLPEFRGAEYMLAGALQQLGAHQTAQRYLDRILRRGSEDPYFAPAMRRMVDVALESGDIAGTARRVNEMQLTGLSEDSQNELRYLEARARFDVGSNQEAEQLLAQITVRSRFYASAQYLRGAIATRARDWHTAENHFCTIARQGDRDQFTFYVDWRFFEVKDLARLALGRVAHETQRPEDAFYYYFQVPADSEHVPEALFEAAYAAYEGNDNETAIDLVDQLDTRFPTSPYVDEAAVLRGYIHLSRCEFEQANLLFQRFAVRFAPVLGEVEQVLDNPARAAGVYEELLEEERRADERRRTDTATPDQSATPTARQLLMALLRVDPTFYELHRDVRTLDGLSARAGRVISDLEALAARVHGGESVRAASATVEEPDEATSLTQDVEAARAVLTGLTEQVDAMRRARAPREQVQPVEAELRQLGERVRGLEAQIREASSGGAVEAEDLGSAPRGDLDALLRADVRNARHLPTRVRAVRAKLVEAANGAALAALRQLRSRLGGLLRRARIGRIDAVMGSKRRIEIQIESLAAGRFPPELMDPLRVQGLLRDDEEYWPFEGEFWPDEYEQTDDDDDDAEEDGG